MSKFIASILTAFLVLAGTAVNAATIETNAKQAIVVDFETGAVLMSKNADEQMPTSSMSKVMTMYAVFDAVKKGSLSLNDELTVSEKAWRMGGSKMFVEVDKKVKVEDLIRGVIIQSGNDATIVLAEGLAGTEDAFAQMLTQTAKNLGMENSQFMNASGWPDPDHYSTAEDLAILAKALIKNFPEYYKYYGEKEFTYSNIKQANRNPLLYRNIGADGIKTGHTEAAGYGLIGSGVENNRRVIVVINGTESERERAEEASKLLEWGLKRFENKKIVSADTPVENAEVVMGKEKSVPMILKEDVFLTVPKMAANDISIKAGYVGPLIAPVKQGDEIGVLEITVDGMPPITRPLYAGKSVEGLGFFAKTIQKAKLFIAGQS